MVLCAGWGGTTPSRASTMSATAPASRCACTGQAADLVLGGERSGAHRVKSANRWPGWPISAARMTLVNAVEKSYRAAMISSVGIAPWPSAMQPPGAGIAGAHGAVVETRTSVVM